VLNVTILNSFFYLRLLKLKNFHLELASGLRLLLFTELPRRLILGNWASGINFTRILGASAKYKALPRSDCIRMRPAAYGFPRKLLLSVIR
jgi:hypothetical protein